MPEAPPPRRELPHSWELLRRLGPAAWGAALAVLLPGAGIFLVYAYSREIAAFVASLGPWAPILYILLCGAAAGLAVFPTWVQAVLAGFIFGPTLGIPAAAAVAVGACGVGSLVGYGLGRAISQHRVRRLIDEEPRWRAVRDALVGSGFWRTAGIVALLRVPTTPFALTNFVLASVETALAPYLLGTVVGIAPRTIAAAVIGSHLPAFSKETLKDSDPKWMMIAGLVGLVVVVLILGQIARRALERVGRNGGKAAAPQSIK
ncbi:MAG: VTT domain-containing protein [Phycisphaerales bacterium]